MKLEHSFTVPADIDTVWQAVLDPERVAPCMPGATLTEVDGDRFKGSVKVKVGPISLLYKGSGEFLSKDDSSRSVVIKASGKDARGNGTASATVTVSLRADGDSTIGSVDTDLSITGKPAQFGRGLISEVGGKILNTFATCLATKLAPAEPEAAPAEPPKLSVVEEAVSTGKEAGEEAAEHAPPPSKPKLTAAPEPSNEPIDLLAFAGPSVLKRVAPLAAVVVAVLVFMGLRRRHR
ncbi:MAG: SRPBCC family protein [Actinophytocola sp.]|uniref:SRPBCC family protein n=1 Tax=Actinophytocola sp. TaxID=1872138 RepID=UPI003C74881F